MIRLGLYSKESPHFAFIAPFYFIFSLGEVVRGGFGFVVVVNF